LIKVWKHASSGAYGAVSEGTIFIPAGDSWFDPLNTGEKELEFNHSLYDFDSGTCSSKPRQQLNEITAWNDAPNVYGSMKTWRLSRQGICHCAMRFSRPV